MPSTYTTKQGQAWDEVARDALGDERLMHELMRANPKHRYIVFFSAGTELTVPEVEQDNRPENLPPWKR